MHQDRSRSPIFRRGAGFGVVAPLAASLALAGAVFVVCLIVWTQAVDRRIRSDEEALVRRDAVAQAARGLGPAELEALLVDRFALDQAQVSATPPGTGRAAVVLPAPASATPRILSWRPHRPGADLLGAALTPGLAALALLVAAGALLARRVQRAADHLVASNRAQSAFLADMSHEIRTPLNGVVAVAAALEKSGLSPRQAELVRIIRGSGETLERLLSDVLDLSKIETGALAVEREPFHLAEALRAVAALCAPRAEEKGVDLRLDISPAAEAMVLGDVVRVKQVATNLLSNAVKFTDQGYVALRLVAAPGVDQWRLSVEDTGVGFDPAKKSRIFARFQQADGAVTRRYGGSGLGLSISRRLVDLMGGAMDCDSRPGAGSIFTVDLALPRAEAPPLHEWEPALAAPSLSPDRLDLLDVEAGAVAEVVPLPRAGRRLRVLLADDHPINRRVVQVLLGHLDLDLVTVENGLEACEAFEARRFDVVLMDMQMPVLDGLNAVRRLRMFERRCQLSPALMVMLTANALREHEDLSLRAGADLHMSKPIEPARLFAALETGQARADQAAARVA